MEGMNEATHKYIEYQWKNSIRFAINDLSIGIFSFMLFRPSACLPFVNFHYGCMHAVIEFDDRGSFHPAGILASSPFDCCL